MESKKRKLNNNCSWNCNNDLGRISFEKDKDGNPCFVIYLTVDGVEERKLRLNHDKILITGEITESRNLDHNM